MDAFELVEKLSNKHGITFIFDLPDPSEENEWTVGEYKNEDQSIHLTDDPSIYTVLHEVGHYMHFKKVNPIMRTISHLNYLTTLLILLLLYLGFLSYSILLGCVNVLTTILVVGIFIDNDRHAEKRADKYAYAETKKLWEKEAGR